MLSTFRPSKPSKPYMSNSLSSGKTQWSSGLFELPGFGKAPSEQSFVKPPPDAVDENSSTTQRSHHAVGTKRRHFTQNQPENACEECCHKPVLNGTMAVVAICLHPPSKRRDCPNIRSTRRPLVRLAVTVQDVVPLRGREGHLR